NRAFAGATATGHFARTGPVLGHLVRAGPVPVHFAPTAPLIGDVARARSLPAHFARAGPGGACVLAGPVFGHVAQPALGHLVRAVRAQLGPVHLPRPPKLGMASTSLQLMADGFRSDSDR